MGQIQGAPGPQGEVGPMATVSMGPQPIPAITGSMWWDTVQHVLYVATSPTASELVTQQYVGLNQPAMQTIIGPLSINAADSRIDFLGAQGRVRFSPGNVSAFQLMTTGASLILNSYSTTGGGTMTPMAINRDNGLVSIGNIAIAAGGATFNSSVNVTNSLNVTRPGGGTAITIATVGSASSITFDRANGRSALSFNNGGAANWSMMFGEAAASDTLGDFRLRCWDNSGAEISPQPIGITRANGWTIIGRLDGGNTSLVNTPSVDPHIAGRLWLNAGALMVSQG